MSTASLTAVRVYIVFVGAYDDFYIAGVFTTKELAEADIVQRRQRDYDRYLESHQRERVYVRDWLAAGYKFDTPYKPDTLLTLEQFAEVSGSKWGVIEEHDVL